MVETDIVYKKSHVVCTAFSMVPSALPYGDRDDVICVKTYEGSKGSNLMGGKKIFSFSYSSIPRLGPN